jgi:outer membrane receptor protein involved in Fe transport
VVLNGSTDPCEGATPTFSPAQCANTGVTAGQYGNIPANLAEQYNGQTGGNPDLDPEKSTTKSVGLVFTPTFFPGFSMSVDWYNIEVTKRIGQIGQDVTLERCAETGDAFFCGLIQRAPGTGSLWLSNNGYIVDTTFNTGGLEVEGVDVEATYRFDFADMGFTSGLSNYGGLNFNFQGSFLNHYLVTTLPGDDAFDCAGLYGAVCTGSAVPAAAPMPEWRHKARLTWNTPWDLEVSGTWRHISEITSDRDVAGAADEKLKAMDYFDLAGTWGVRENVTVRFGVNNLFDKDPPLASQSNCPAGPCSGNTYPQTYDPMGRYLFVGARMDF